MLLAEIFQNRKLIYLLNIQSFFLVLFKPFLFEFNISLKLVIWVRQTLFLPSAFFIVISNLFLWLFGVYLGTQLEISSEIELLILVGEDLELILLLFGENQIICSGLFLHEFPKGVFIVKSFQVIVDFFVGKFQKFIINLQTSRVLINQRLQIFIGFKAIFIFSDNLHCRFFVFLPLWFLHIIGCIFVLKPNILLDQVFKKAANVGSVFWFGSHISIVLCQFFECLVVKHPVNADWFAVAAHKLLFQDDLDGENMVFIVFW